VGIDNENSTVLTASLGIVWLVVAAAAALPGLRYYALPLSERAFSPLHETFAPTGRAGHSYGLAGAVLMLLGVAGYSVRKRWSALREAGKLRDWLHVHIFCCTLGPFLVLLHTTFKFGGLVAISFFSMVLVVASGVFGRYVYVRIPKTVHGRFRTLEEVRRERSELVAALSVQSGIPAYVAESIVSEPAASTSLVSALARSVTLERRARAQIRSARRVLNAHRVAPEAVASVTDLLVRQEQLQRQLALLAPFHRLFRYWHLFHTPFAIVMLVILLVHIGVAIAFGYGWPF
jgi:hypothetical protein